MHVIRDTIHPAKDGPLGQDTWPGCIGHRNAQHAVVNKKRHDVPRYYTRSAASMDMTARFHARGHGLTHLERNRVSSDGRRSTTDQGSGSAGGTEQERGNRNGSGTGNIVPPDEFRAACTFCCPLGDGMTDTPPSRLPEPPQASSDRPRGSARRFPPTYLACLGFAGRDSADPQSTPSKHAQGERESPKRAT